MYCVLRELFFKNLEPTLVKSFNCLKNFFRELSVDYRSTFKKIYFFVLYFSFCRYGKDTQHLHHLAQKMEDLIFNVADTTFFFNDLEECDAVIN